MRLKNLRYVRSVSCPKCQEHAHQVEIILVTVLKSIDGNDYISLCLSIIFDYFLDIFTLFVFFIRF